MTSFYCDLLFCSLEVVKQKTDRFFGRDNVSCQCRRLVMSLTLHPVVWNEQPGLMLQYTNRCKCAHFDE